MQTQQTNLTQASTSEAAQPIDNPRKPSPILAVIQSFRKTLSKLLSIDRKEHAEKESLCLINKFPAEVITEILKKIYCNQNQASLKADLCNLVSTSKNIRKEILKLDLELKMSGSEQEKADQIMGILKIIRLLRSVDPAYTPNLKPINCVEALYLNSEEINVNDQDLATIATLVPNLKKLEFLGNPITDDGLKHLNSLSSLRELSLAFCKLITDGGIGNLSGSTNLEILDLIGCNLITDDGIRKALLLPKIKLIGIGLCVKISDKMLKDNSNKLMSC